jgi:hypothetical protein
MLKPEHAEVLRKQFLKGVGAFVVLAAAYLCAIGLVGTRTGENLTTIIDVAAFFMMFLVVQTYSRALAALRLGLARTEQDPLQVRLLLEPFRGFRSRFDRSGEAHYLLARAALELGDLEMVAQLVEFLRRFRRGEFSDKARSLNPRVNPDSNEKH